MTPILGLPTLKSTILIGAGHLGQALAGKMNFESVGFRLDAVFDCAPAVIGKPAGALTVRAAETLAEYCRTHKPEMAILCIPENAAPETVDLLIGCGVGSFWNFSHYDIRRRHPEAFVENVHMSDSLMTLSYIMNHKKEP